MTPNLNEKVCFLRDLDEVCEKCMEENKGNASMLKYIKEYQDNLREELDPLEQEEDYYALKYAPTEADL